MKCALHAWGIPNMYTINLTPENAVKFMSAVKNPELMVLKGYKKANLCHDQCFSSKFSMFLSFYLWKIVSPEGFDDAWCHCEQPGIKTRVWINFGILAYTNYVQSIFYKLFNDIFLVYFIWEWDHMYWWELLKIYASNKWAAIPCDTSWVRRCQWALLSVLFSLKFPTPN